MCETVPTNLCGVARHDAVGHAPHEALDYLHGREQWRRGLATCAVAEEDSLARQVLLEKRTIKVSAKQMCTVAITNTLAILTSSAIRLQGWSDGLTLLMYMHEEVHSVFRFHHDDALWEATPSTMA